MVKTQNIDTELLAKAIDASGIKSSHFADTLGISRQSFNNKCRGKSQFKLSEVYVMGDLLKLSNEKKDEIFFPKKV